LAAGGVAFAESVLGDPGRELLSNPHACEKGFRDTKSTHYGLDLAGKSRIQAGRRANLLLIAALVIFVLWIVDVCLKGSVTDGQIRVNSGHMLKK
jgi:hypothetical protein